MKPWALWVTISKVSVSTGISYVTPKIGCNTPPWPDIQMQMCPSRLPDGFEFKCYEMIMKKYLRKVHLEAGVVSVFPP